MMLGKLVVYWSRWLGAGGIFVMMLGQLMMYMSLVSLEYLPDCVGAGHRVQGEVYRVDHKMLLHLGNL